ncbi:MAG: 50S ribosomal protein L13 [Flavobacteriales bacterium]|nr:MAG: 50S ribosomal protein L13 [Flavobacteriales bacterium]
MDKTSYKTVSANKATVNKKWLLVNAEEEVLGRLASRVAKMLRGKHKTNFTPHVDCGDNIVVVNAEKIHLTGNKFESKKYIRHTGYPGGQRETSISELLAKKPTAVIEKAVKGMLPKNRLGSELFRNLYVYAGNEHPHEAQKPTAIKLNEIK